jgi:hypothetical protein
LGWSTAALVAAALVAAALVAAWTARPHPFGERGAATGCVRLTFGSGLTVDPALSPDGTLLLFLGNRDANLYDERTMDWWVTDVDSGALVRTGAATVFKAMGFASASQAPDGWTTEGVLTSAAHGDTRNIWRVRSQ